jgi:hypothetical protein
MTDDNLTVWIRLTASLHTGTVFSKALYSGLSKNTLTRHAICCSQSTPGITCRALGRKFRIRNCFSVQPANSVGNHITEML